MYTYIIAGLCVDQIFPAVNYAFPREKKSSRFARALCVVNIHIGVSIGLQRFFQKLSQLNKIVLKQVEEHAKTK